MQRRFYRTSVVREVRYYSLEWKLLLLGLARGIRATQASSGLGSGRAGSTELSLGWGVSALLSLYLPSHRSRKGYPVPMFLGLFNLLDNFLPAP